MQRILSLQTMAVELGGGGIEGEAQGSWSTLSENGCEDTSVYSMLSNACTLQS